jgi:ornithine--oxo-acid transaminase
MLSGIEFTAPRKLALLVPYKAFQQIHAAMFGQFIVMRMFRDHNILTQICGNNFLVLKVAPPLVVTEQQMQEFVSAIRDIVEVMHSSSSFWTEALGLARRALNI